MCNVSGSERDAYPRHRGGVESRGSGTVVGVVPFGFVPSRGVQQTIGRLVLLLLPWGSVASGRPSRRSPCMAGRAMRPARESFEKQRAFVADASHELKTPSP